MSSLGGLKHAATEPSHLDNKRDVRRRGAEGRAAALRRAPSDSDCSGETASLSADSNERLRPVLPPPRANKTRSRRRGSEWEVLEGLKDGQRFERRPDVFNGYLHKKRKWPLKGWHKRFFVVDGGILVYARSPTDVARGRLHGSVDVGLSVISAKARRRRIDIDADEFIYHLRAKTADVFRTWLTVLKTHRLYRQHLLTFGARESVPKIHAPLEDLPPTDTSSRTTIYTISSSTQSKEDLPRRKEILQSSPNFSKEIVCYNQSPIYLNTERNKEKKNSSSYWLENPVDTNVLIPLKFEPLETEIVNLKPDLYNHSLCSMKCMERIYENDYEELKKDENDSSGISQAENQIVCTELDRNSLKNNAYVESSTYDNSLIVNSSNEKEAKEKVIRPFYPIAKSKDKFKQSLTFFERNIEPTAALFLFPKRKKSKKRDKTARLKKSDSLMKRSKKSTNLVKYKNSYDEPPLKKPLSKSMLLRKHKLRVSRQSGSDTVATYSSEVQAVDAKENKSLQDLMTASEYDRLAEKLVVNIFNKKNSTAQTSDTTYNVKYWVNHMVKELYDIKFSQSNVHPVKVLFRCLLEFWLKTSAADDIRKAIRQVKSIDIQSHNYFTRDEQLSSLMIETATENTQFHGYEIYEPKQDKRRNGSVRQGTCSFIKERRVQELERLLKNTVYTCETICNNRSKEKDIAITKKLIDNLNNPKGSYNSSSDGTRDNSNSSTELPEIQDTINRLISETSIPPDLAKEFLAAYLDVLVNDSVTPDSTQSSDDSKVSQETPACDVQAESVQRKMSVGVITADKKDDDKSKSKDDKLKGTDTVIIEQDPGQKYLKDVLDKITAIFSKVKTAPNKSTCKDVQPDDTKVEGAFIGSKDTYNVNKIVSENKDSIVVDLTKYQLDHIAMLSDPDIQGVMSIMLKLKERPPNFGESKPKNLNFKFSDEQTSDFNPFNGPDRLIDDSSKRYLKNLNDPRNCFKNPFIDYDSKCQKNNLELKPFLSTSDATSKAYKMLYESQHSFDYSTKNNNLEKNEECRDDLQSCYILSSVKKSALSTASQLRKKIFSKDETVTLVNPNEASTSPTKRSDTTETDKANPKIIDEKFILLLLENLTLLSQNVPGLHKDISSLYVKLRKKHEKDLRNLDARLGLLGKIYKDADKDSESGTKSEVNVTYDIPLKIKSSKTEIGLNTNEVLVKTVDKAASGLLSIAQLSDAAVQTEDHTVKRKSITFMDTSISKQIFEFETINSNFALKPYFAAVDVAISNTNWFQKGTPDHSSAMQYIFKDEESANTFRLAVDKRPKSAKTPKEYNSKMKNRSRENISMPDRFAGRRNLTDTIHDTPESTRASKPRKFKKDFNVYQLFVSGVFPPLSSSLSGSNVETHLVPNVQCSDEMKTIYRCTSEPSYCSGLVSPLSPPLRGPQAGFVAGTPGGRLASWIIESGGPLENASRELGQAQLSVQQLQRLLDALDTHHQHDNDQVSLEGASPNVKKDRRKFGLRKKKSNSKSIELAPIHLQDVSASHMALSALTAPPSPGGGASSVPNSAASLPIACAAARPQSLPAGPEMGPASLASITPDHQLREDFTVLAKDLVHTLKGVVTTLVLERGRLRAAMEAADGAHSPPAVLRALRTNLSSALQQNSELRSRLSRIHDASDLAEISSVNNTDNVGRPFQQSLSYSSSCVSASEFFDAEEHEDQVPDILPADEAGVIELDGDSSSEAGSLSSEEGSASSDNSDGAPEAVTVRLNNGTAGPDVGSDVAAGWTRRTRLPCPRPTPGGPSLWNLLYKNIGKDLSQVSMPVTINEPLNMLQRLCEELEYSELLDAAAGAGSAAERMCLVAAFAVSAYAASAHRAASKPFNPLLGESYECVRADRGFRFLAEQVSHHPPISACHAESPRWCFWQEARIKTKFWGKSMEFQPAGRVHVRLLPQGDHYSWNKVTTCVHNLFGGQRWVDQYGDMHIVCHGTEISAKLNFIKASSWSSSRHEVRGFVSDGATGVRLRLQGRWSEALYAGEPPSARCLWRPGAMPPEHDIYYGFTRFAMELNEMEPGMREILPHTDTRFRPDQRALEEGDVEAAEQFKHELEQAQRERRRNSSEHTPAWFRKSVEGGEEMWVFTGEYWRARESGLARSPQLAAAPRIW